MNEKIKHMIEQAGTDVSGKWISLNNAEQLTRLIVQQAVDLIQARTISEEVTEWEQGYNRALKKIQADITEKFGVES
jgi:hypothetical protein